MLILRRLWDQNEKGDFDEKYTIGKRLSSSGNPMKILMIVRRLNNELRWNIQDPLRILFQ